MTAPLDLSAPKNGQIAAFLTTAEIAKGPVARSEPPARFSRRRDQSIALRGLEQAEDLRGPLHWLGRDLTAAEWESDLGKNAIPHAVQLNIEAKAGVDMAALAKGRASSGKALATAAFVRGTALGERVLPQRVGMLAFYETSHALLQEEEAKGAATVKAWADQVESAETQAQQAERRAMAEMVLSTMGHKTDALERVMAVRDGLAMLRREAMAYEKAVKDGLRLPFERQAFGGEGMSFARWLSQSGLVAPEQEALFELNVLKQWVVAAREIRKDGCEDHCGTCHAKGGCETAKPVELARD